MASTEKKPIIPKIEIKLLINKKDQKVLYAEASKEFIDFLFSLMSLPLGMVIKLLANKKTLGSIANLYNSIKSFNQTYLESSQNLDSVLNPKPPQIALESPLLVTPTDSAKGGKGNIYMCPYRERDRFGFANYGSHPTMYVAGDPDTLCHYCKTRMTDPVQFANKDCSSGSAGFVKGLVTYMVMDNLEVKPLSTISGLALLNSSNIQDLNSLEEMVVHVGASEGLKLLEESMQSKNVLTSVFLAKRSKRRI